MHASGASYRQLGVIFGSKGETSWMARGTRGFQRCSLVMGLCKASVRTCRMVGWPLELAWEAGVCMDRPPSMRKMHTDREQRLGVGDDLAGS